MSEKKREERPDEESDALSEEDLEKVSGGTGQTGASLNLKKSTLKSSKIANPIINMGMEKNDAEEMPGGAANKAIK